MAGSDWYLFDGERQLGPLNWNELSHFLRVQDLSKLKVWREGLTEWVPAAELPELALARPPVPKASVNDHGQNTSKKRGRFNNFIAKNWRGEFSLATSYWLFGFLGNLFVSIFAAVVVAAFQLDSGYQPKAIFASISIAWAGIAAIAVWQSVGVWRSANRHINARTILGKRSPWAGLAKIAVFVGVLRLIGNFLSSGWPQLLEAGRISFLSCTEN